MKNESKKYIGEFEGIWVRCVAVEESNRRSSRNVEIMKKFLFTFYMMNNKIQRISKNSAWKNNKNQTTQDQTAKS